jgi:HSP20 family protein
MALVRWNPWSELFDLHSQMDSLFGQVLDSGRPATQFAGLPVDIRQSDEGFTIEASVPGFRPEDVEVTVDNGVLTLRGEHREETDAGKGEYVRRERRMTSFYRQIGLPQDVRADDISATFENGVLSLQLPRMEKPQPKRIPVTPSAEAKVIAQPS